MRKIRFEVLRSLISKRSLLVLIPIFALLLFSQTTYSFDFGKFFSFGSRGQQTLTGAAEEIRTVLNAKLKVLRVDPLDVKGFIAFISRSPLLATDGIRNMRPADAEKLVSDLINGSSANADKKQVAAANSAINSIAFVKNGAANYSGLVDVLLTLDFAYFRMLGLNLAYNDLVKLNLNRFIDFKENNLNWGVKETVMQWRRFQDSIMAAERGGHKPASSSGDGMTGFPAASVQDCITSSSSGESINPVAMGVGGDNPAPAGSPNDAPNMPANGGKAPDNADCYMSLQAGWVGDEEGYEKNLDKNFDEKYTNSFEDVKKEITSGNIIDTPSHDACQKFAEEAMPGDVFVVQGEYKAKNYELKVNAVEPAPAGGSPGDGQITYTDFLDTQTVSVDKFADYLFFLTKQGKTIVRYLSGYVSSKEGQSRDNESIFKYSPDSPSGYKSSDCPGMGGFGAGGKGLVCLPIGGDGGGCDKNKPTPDDKPVNCPPDAGGQFNSTVVAKFSLKFDGRTGSISNPLANVKDAVVKYGAASSNAKQAVETMLNQK